MEPRLGTAPGREIAVGRTREEAASIFGRYFENPLVTTYDAFPPGADQDRTVGLVAGPGTTALLEQLSRQDPGLSSTRILLGLPLDLTGRDELLAALDRNRSVAVTALLETGHGTVLTLAPSSTVGPADHDAFVADLRGRAVPAPVVAPTRSEPTSAAPTVLPSGGARAPRSRRVLLRAAGAALLLAVLAAAAMVGIGRSLGTDAVLVTLALVAVAVQVLLVLIGLYAVRLARGTRAAQEHLEQTVLPRTERLLRLSKESARRDRDRERELRADLLRLQREVTALGRLASRSRIEAKERH